MGSVNSYINGCDMCRCKFPCAGTVKGSEFFFAQGKKRNKCFCGYQFKAWDDDTGAWWVNKKGVNKKWLGSAFDRLKCPRCRCKYSGENGKTLKSGENCMGSWQFLDETCSSESNGCCKLGKGPDSWCPIT